MDDGCVRQTAKFVDELAHCDDRGVVDDPVMILTHGDLLLHSTTNRGWIASVPSHSAHLRAPPRSRNPSAPLLDPR
ncbi:protein of unknown function [Bradyrhizobium vignae]|uniref:Uncharacterized protein n=1 Tax=Bradyrhizobium vignae TaxID=1549949 RepID=A0A2U3PZA4_9BRAD|nr:protein of unknown function [Bradyrhizobium vignae]